MRNRLQLLAGRFLAVAGLALCCNGAVWAQPTAFSYQGKLTDAGNPANGNFDLQFKLFDSLSGGLQQGGTLVRNPVSATAGVFTVILDFTANVFDGSERYLEIGVRPAGSGNAYAVLVPRQHITSSPYAIQTLNAQSLGGLPANRYVASDATGNVGIGTASPQSKFHVVSGAGQLPPRLQSSGTTGFGAGWDFYLGATGKGFVGAPDASSAIAPGELILYGGAGTKTSIWAGAVRGITIDTQGYVGVATAPNLILGRLVAAGDTNGTGIYGSSFNSNGVVGSSTNGVGVSGTSGSAAGVGGEATNGDGVNGYSHGACCSGVHGTNDAGGYGVQGFSFAGRGVVGTSSSSTGVAGYSTSSSGVYGESPVSSLTAGGVYGKGTGSGSIGVIGEANVANAVGVFGVSTSATGYAMYARNNAGGQALYVEGNAGQTLGSGGLAKALIHVAQNGTIQYCYNGLLNLSTGNCGFSVQYIESGRYAVDFGFRVDNRFLSVSPRHPASPGTKMGASWSTSLAFSVNKVEVLTYITGTSSFADDADFMIIVY